NNFVPHDCVRAFAMTTFLVGSGRFDHYVAVAPEGHIYGYFFEKLDVQVLSGFADYPPTRFEPVDDLDIIKAGRVLIIEDDVIGGRTLRLVVDALLEYQPKTLALYLGHTRGIQHLENVPPHIDRVYLAEDQLDDADRDQQEAEFVQFFGRAA